MVSLKQYADTAMYNKWSAQHELIGDRSRSGDIGA